jgi:signal transduction histidine kinase
MASKSNSDQSQREIASNSQELSPQQLHAQKMASLGIFSSYIAHEINNTLTIILANTEMAGLKVDADSPAHANLAKAQKAVDGTRELIRGLATFGTEVTDEINDVDLTRSLSEALDFLQKLLPNSIQLIRDLGDTTFILRAQKLDIQQVVLNLFANSIAAIGHDTGEIKVTLAAIDAGKQPGSRDCVITVSDNGGGIDDSVVDQIFDPFFTTKAVGQGGGLGLAASKTIINRLGGHISVESNSGEGTTFKIVLPSSASSQLELKYS